MSFLVCDKVISFCLGLLLLSTLAFTSQPTLADQYGDYQGDADRGRLVFGPCRTCHYPEKEVGHHNGPSLYQIFGKTAGKQVDFDEYSETFLQAEFVWTPELLFLWLKDVEGMFPETTMMSLNIEDPQDRADLIAYLERFK